jgi:hypothetical protein
MIDHTMSTEEHQLGPDVAGIVPVSVYGCLPVRGPMDNLGAIAGPRLPWP